jgi:iron complex transport system substrate-binding protein
MVTRFRFRVVLFLAVSAVFIFTNGCFRQSKPIDIPPKRIVSMAPSITETLFALGLGDRIIGVTRYCTYPPQTNSIEKIGGYSDANLEKIIVLHPDLVVLLREHEKQQSYLNRFGVSTLMIDNSTCAALCSSFARIGRRCGVTRAADSLNREFHEHLKKTNAIQSSPPKVLFCVGRDGPGAGRIKSVYAAGGRTFYNDLIVAAGGENAFSNSTPAYSKLSPEGILSLAPDIVIDVAPAMGNYACDLLVADWNSMGRIPAVKHKRVYCMSKDYATVPGPRALLLLDDLKRIIADTNGVNKDYYSL